MAAAQAKGEKKVRTARAPKAVSLLTTKRMSVLVRSKDGKTEAHIAAKVGVSFEAAMEAIKPLLAPGVETVGIFKGAF